MASGTEQTPSGYIQHHLTFFEKPIGDGGFWSINVDSISVSILLGVIGIGFLWWVVRGGVLVAALVGGSGCGFRGWVVRGATAGVPNKRQAFVELLFDFIDDQVKGIF